MAPRKNVFAVEGSGSFPFDMLRYDRCYPVTESDSCGMAEPYGHGASAPHRRVLLMCPDRDPQSPTIGRWESFGWKVVDLTDDEDMRYS